MDPNNQQPQSDLTGINKLEEDLQKMTEANMSSTQTPSVSAIPSVPPLVSQEQVPSQPLQSPLPVQSPNIVPTNNDGVASGQPPEPGVKKSNLVLTIALVLMALAVVIAIAYVLGTKMNTNKNTQATTSPVAVAVPTSAPVVTPSDSSSSAIPTSAPLAITDKTIDIKSFAYNPTDLIVKAGETVMVTNNDTVAHSVTEDSGLFDTDLLNVGQTKTFTAPSKPGTYKYHCSAHLNMTATLTVE